MSEPADQRRRPLRNNGLAAPAFASLVDIDPRATASLLESLRDAGVAAYVEPVPGSVGGYLEVRLPDRPMDRLWVARGDEARARALVAAELRELDEVPADDGVAVAGGTGSRAAVGGRDEAAVWAEIVAAWQRGSQDPVPRWSVSEDVDDPAAGNEPPEGQRPAAAAAPPRAGDEGEDEDEEHFVPPPPPPLPSAHRVTLAAWLAVAVGAVFLFAPGLFGLASSNRLVTLGVFAIVAGAATLVWRLRDAPVEDSDPDDGAVV